MKTANIETICPANRQEWRDWLQEHHHDQPSVWLIYYKKSSVLSAMSWSEAVDEALCFGWVDSKRKALDEEKFVQFFGKRKAKSTWSKINKDKIQRLIEEGLMTEAGHKSVAIARQNGSWNILDEVEAYKIPKDLAKEFKGNAGSKKYFLSLSKSVQKAILQWLLFAKKRETRQKRITEIAELASQKKKPKQF